MIRFFDGCYRLPCIIAYLCAIASFGSVAGCNKDNDFLLPSSERGSTKGIAVYRLSQGINNIYYVAAETNMMIDFELVRSGSKRFDSRKDMIEYLSSKSPGVILFDGLTGRDWEGKPAGDGYVHARLSREDLLAIKAISRR